MNRYLFILILVSVTTRSFSQSIDAYTHAIDFLPPPPNATAIMKHDAIALNKNTGAPNINIPLMPLKGIKLDLASSISYASTGIKVDEIASRVGMGWTIQMGGVVTRTVRGSPDETTTRLSSPSFLNDCQTYTYFQNATQPPSKDTEPDLFTFSMNGLAGSFVLDQNMNPVILSGQKYKIQYDLTSTNPTWSFKIIDDEGIIYYFGGTAAVEKTSRQSVCARNFLNPIPVSWYLTKIQHPNGEVINFNYSPISYSYDAGYSETQQWRYALANTNFADPKSVTASYCPYCDPVAPSYCAAYVNTTGAILSSISTTAGYSATIGYTARTDCSDKLISTIAYYGPDGTSIGSYSFQYNTIQSNLNYANSYGTYFGYDKTPYLVSLTEYASGGAAVNAHLFTYIDPAGRAPRLSLSQDHWGYFNGVFNSSSFIPTPTTADLITKFPSANANREPQEQYAMKGMLCKIQYPTGGSDTIIYESNKQAIGIKQPTHMLYGQVTGSGLHDQQSASYSFSVPSGQTVSFKFSCDSASATDSIHNVGTFTVIQGGTTLTNQTLRVGQSTTLYFDVSGNYTLQLYASGTSVTARAIVTYHASTLTNTYVDAPVGGLRVKTIITSAKGQPAQIKRYFYGELSTMNLSSQVNVPQPIYSVNTRTAITCNMTLKGGGEPLPYTGTCTGIAMYSNSQRNLYDFMGTPVSYSSVIESIGPNFEGGGTQTRFLTQRDAAGQIVFGHDIPNATYSNFSAFYNGKQKEVTLLKKTASGGLIPVKTTLYTYKSDTAGARTVSGYAVQMDYTNTWHTDCSPDNNPVVPLYLDPYSAVRYDLAAPWVYNDTLTVKTYDVNGLNPVISTTINKYENPSHRQLTYTQTTTSDRHLRIEKRKYPADYSSTQIYATMIAANIITPVTDVTTYIDTAKISEVKMNYADWGNSNYALASVQNSFYNAALINAGTIDAYNRYGNVTQYTGKDKVTTAILWGGKAGQYPVAKISGATYSSAVGYLGVVDTTLYNLNEADTRAKIDLVRTGLTGAQVTAYTYKQKVGLSSITDPRKDISTYIYDSKDRLATIFNADGNIVKNYGYNFGMPTADNTTGYVGNDFVSGSFTCQSCEPGFSAQALYYGIASNSFFAATKADANSLATAALQVQGQNYANQFSTCSENAPVYWNTQQTGQFQKSDCGPTYTGSWVTDTVKAHAYSGVTQYDANQLAIYNLNQQGQAYANTHGTCTPNCTTDNCTGPDKKCVNGVCETGQKIYTSSVQQHGSLWICTYHYRWSDGGISADYTESSTTSCAID